MLDRARVEAAVPASSLDDAREFYEGVLGLRPAGEHAPGVDITYECGDGTRLMVYEHPGPTAVVPAAHTVAHFVVGDVATAVRDLAGRGVRFEEYDLPELKTVNSVATIGNRRYAWFKDPDANVLAIHD